jgi:hypothetical protein
MKKLTRWEEMVIVSAHSGRAWVVLLVKGEPILRDEVGKSSGGIPQTMLEA